MNFLILLGAIISALVVITIFSLKKYFQNKKRRFLVISILIFLAIIGGSVWFYPWINQPMIEIGPPEVKTVDCKELEPQYCQKDEDCVCKQEKGCFMGNKKYYFVCIKESRKSSQSCQDLCSQELCECVNNTCNCGEDFA